MRLRRQDRGLTLLELVIAVFVLALGSLAALRATDQSRIAIGGAQDRVLAGLAATNRAEELRLLGTAEAQPNSVNFGGRAFDVRHTLEPTAGGLIRVEVTARSQNGPGAVRVIYLAPGLP